MADPWLSGGEIIFFRSLFALPILLVLGLRHSSAPARLLATAHPWRHVLRGMVVLVTIVTFFIALRHLPLATVTVITLSNPVFMLLLSLVWLGERVGRRQWLAVVLGLLGVWWCVAGPACSSTSTACWRWARPCLMPWPRC
jgi:drug/metabolite transporter (DMT)-like permease